MRHRGFWIFLSFVICTSLVTPVNKHTEAQIPACPDRSHSLSIDSSIIGTPKPCGGILCDYIKIDNYTYSCDPTPGSDTKCVLDKQAVIQATTTYTCAQTPDGEGEECSVNSVTIRGAGRKTIPC